MTKILLILTIIFTSLFFFFPELDNKVVDMTYDSTKGFIWIDQAFFRFIYRSVYVIVPSTIIILIFLRVKAFINNQIDLARKVSYLLICLLIGPGLIVNILLKENFGRARPAQIKETNKIYSKIFILSDQCSSNCSFTSGHAAIGFYFSSLSYIVKRKKYFVTIFTLSILLGSVLGLARILQGAHFLSDVVFSGLIVNIVNSTIAKIYIKN